MERKVLFGYGSKTGTAASLSEEAYAMVVDSDADEKFDLALPEELNDLVPTVLENRTSHLLLVLCCSSTGAGELPPNAAKFYDALLGAKVTNVDFVILCLGDSNYSSFMEAPHKLTKALISAGANLVSHLYEADDSSTSAFGDVTDSFIESVSALVADWYSSKLRPMPPVFHQLSSTARTESRDAVMGDIISFVSTSTAELSTAKLAIPKLPAPTFNLASDQSEVEQDAIDFARIQNGDNFDPLNSPPYDCKVLSARKLTGRAALKHCWEITVSLPEDTRLNDDNGRELCCGDCVALFTPNNPSEVSLVLSRIGDGTNRTVVAHGPRKPSWFPAHASLTNILRYDVELRSSVSKAMLGHLAKHCANEQTRRRLFEFVSREGKETFRQLLQKQVTFVDVLRAFPELTIELEVLTFLRRLQRRWYSIANYIDYRKLCEGSRPIKIAFTVVSSPKTGLMSGQLVSLCERANEKESPDAPVFGPNLNRVILQCRDPPPNQFRLVDDPTIPIMMVAAGSGIAPFVGFLERWAEMRGKEATLIYGCRDNDSYLYKDKLESLKNTGVLTNLIVAFSRIEPKKYVQDVMAEMAGEIKTVIDRQGVIYICGDGGGMGIGIREVFSEIFGKDGYFKLTNEKRIREDLWR